MALSEAHQKIPFQKGNKLFPFNRKLWEMHTLRRLETKRETGGTKPLESLGTCPSGVYTKHCLNRNALVTGYRGSRRGFQGPSWELLLYHVCTIYSAPPSLAAARSCTTSGCDFARTCKKRISGWVEESGVPAASRESPAGAVPAALEPSHRRNKLCGVSDCPHELSVAGEVPGEFPWSLKIHHGHACVLIIHTCAFFYRIGIIFLTDETEGGASCAHRRCAKKSTNNLQSSEIMSG